MTEATMRGLATGLLVLLGACDRATPAPALPPAVDAGTTWATVTSAARRVLVEAPARVLPAPQATAQLSAPLRATVTAIRVRPGDRVEAGAALLEVVMPEVLDAAGRFDGARVRLAAWSERSQALAQLKSEGLTRSLEVSEAAAKVAEAKADLQAARATLLVAGVREADVAGLLAGSGAVALRSPVAGVVTEVTAALREAREPSGPPLVVVVGDGPTRIEARFARPVPDGDYTFVGARGRTPLTLVARAPAADARDATFVAWFEPGVGERVPAGSLGRVTVAGRDEDDVVTVPVGALRRDGATATVQGAGGTPVTVEVLECGDEVCVVRGALKAGEAVRVGAAK